MKSPLDRPAGQYPRAGLLAALRDALRGAHYSLRTERAYVLWTRRFAAYHGGRSPRDLGAAEVTAFLTSLAVKGEVAAATQNQALAAILFVYRHVLKVDLPWLDEIVRAKKPRRLPTVLSVEQVEALLAKMEGITGLMAQLMYGTGMRLAE